MKEQKNMKIELMYKEPGTQIEAYMFHTIYDEKDIDEACEERAAAEHAGYEIAIWRLIHNEDA